MAKDSAKTRIGVIGIGGMGSHHARYLFNGDVPNAELTAVCDTDPARLEWAKKTFGDTVARFDNGGDLFAAKLVDAVMIATPHYFHPTYAVQAFENGVHVLTEKPAGVYTKQVREMNEAAEKSGLVFSIMFQMRTVPLFRKMREMVSSGELGEIRRVVWIATRWFRAQSYYDSGGWRASWAGEGGGVLINQCPHNLDVWQWVCGLPKRMRAFCSFGKYHNIEVEDDVTAYMEYENGATGLFVTTTGESPGSDHFEIIGDNGKLSVENGKLVFYRTREPVSKFCREYPGGFGEPEVWRCELPLRGDNSGHAGITKNWVQAIREGKELIAPGTEGIKGLELSNSMYLSAWTDAWVDLPVDEEKFLSELNQRIKTSTYKKDAGGKALDVEDSWH